MPVLDDLTILIGQVTVFLECVVAPFSPLLSEMTFSQVTSLLRLLLASHQLPVVFSLLSNRAGVGLVDKILLRAAQLKKSDSEDKKAISDWCVVCYFYDVKSVVVIGAEMVYCYSWYSRIVV